MIYLDDSLFIGKGFHHTAYAHPTDQHLCIKILHNSRQDAQKQHERELKYNQKLQRKNKHKQLVGMACYLGTIETNLGEGFIFQLIRDNDGNISKSLATYLNDQDFVQQHWQAIRTDLDQLKQRMFDQQIIPMKIFAKNILYRKLDESNYELVIIDGLGSATFIPLEYYFSCAAKARINRKWREFESTLPKILQNG